MKHLHLVVGRVGVSDLGTRRSNGRGVRAGTDGAEEGERVVDVKGGGALGEGGQHLGVVQVRKLG